jgi:hypothetical protein
MRLWVMRWFASLVFGKATLVGNSALNGGKGTMATAMVFWSDHLRVGAELIVFAKRGQDGVYGTSICYPTKPVSP